MNLFTRVMIGLFATGTKATGAASTNLPDSDPAQGLMGVAWQNGTSANQANQSYHTSATPASAAAVTYDFTTGLADKFGDAVVLAAVKALFIQNTGTTTLTITGTNGIVGSGFTLIAGESVLFAVGTTGHTTTNAKTIIVTNAAGSAGAYTILVVGVTS